MEHDESDGGSDDSDDDFEVITIISKQTGHLCSSFEEAGAGSFEDGVDDDAKNGPSKLTPSSPLT
jgi:glucose dehydrogenase